MKSNHSARHNRASKRSVSTKAIATFSVEWCYELHCIVLSPDEWSKVRDGAPITKSGDGYYYEGEFFQDHWRFNSPKGSLSVQYGEDGGEGWSGSWQEALKSPGEAAT